MLNTLHVEYEPVNLIRERRRITGMSAILLPFRENGDVDWDGFEDHLKRTVEARLIPAVNMDTGFVNLIDDATRLEVLSRATALCDQFVAGAFVKDQKGDSFDYDSYARRIEEIVSAEGTPVIFQSYGLTRQSDEDILKAYTRLGECCEQFFGFELGDMFAPFGKIYSLELYRELVRLNACVGAKHSSLRRDLEWQRIQIRNETRPEFMVLTGNDLAIDMVAYGSDYLLGLSTFAPDQFARRDAMWANGDPSFWELNDVLQYLGFLSFRSPVPAYKHSAAMFLKLRGWLTSDKTHPNSPQRPGSDQELLKDIMRQLEIG